MRRIASIALICFVLCGICMPAYAESYSLAGSGAANRKMVISNGYFVTISEQVTEMNQTVRIYNKQPLARGAVATCSVMTEEEKSEQAEAILLTLGMDKQDISDIPEDTLLSAVDCEQIINTISHTKCDADGNVTYLSDAQMSEIAATLSQRPENTYDEREGDEYMTVSHTVYYYGDGLYRFTTQARWLTMPFWRETDSIGSCAQDIGVVPDSEYGVINYTSTTYYYWPLTGEPREKSEEKNILDIRPKSLGTWDGRAGVFKLPKDADSQEIDITISDFRAYFEFRAYVRTVTDEKYFGSVGTYAHTQMTLDYDPTLTIEPGRNVSFSVGVSTAKTEERRSAEMLLHYVPG